MTHIVIVGGGVAAGSAAKTLVDEGFDGDVTIVADEAHPPYQRPPLSKGYLAGKESLDAVILHPREWYAEHGIDLRTSTQAVGLDPREHELRLADGAVLRYDSVVIATGSSPRTLPMEGADLPGVATLRRLDDSDDLAAQLRDGGRRLVLIGSGWIGMEVAATARELGNQVTVLERDPVPLAVALGKEMGEVFRGLHEERGVDLRTSVDVQKISGTERADGVVVDGETVPADIVLMGVGAVPNTGLAERAGLALGNGILTDSGLRTSAPDVYAAGDVANAYHPVIQRHLRSEHWANALHAGPVAARAMLGEAGVVRRYPLLLHGSVRSQHGALGVRAAHDRGAAGRSRGPRGARVRRILGRRRAHSRRYERQRAEGQQGRPGADPVGWDDERREPARPFHPARAPGRGTLTRAWAGAAPIVHAGTDCALDDLADLRVGRPFPIVCALVKGG